MNEKFNKIKKININDNLDNKSHSAVSIKVKYHLVAPAQQQPDNNIIKHKQHS